ncbi:helix-turn-helix domain-containing protein [Streptomyces sp. NPDC048604]|uniref:helix-turn-helix domain-containing protein n=1 Tax=Streptomyces sp. NPDC048604 TaxID=3365578 RepID=UPI0037232BB3
MARGSRQDAWEFFGAELKRRREVAGVTQGELGRRVFVSGGYIGQFEQAIRKPQLDVAQRIDEVLQTDGFFERLCRKLIDKSPYASYFAAAAELERVTTEMCEFAPTLVPGVLQTESYARAIMRASNPFTPEESIDAKVSARLERAEILKGPSRPPLWVVMHETVLRTPAGGPAVMAEQLEHLTAAMTDRKALVQVIPFAAGAYPEMSSTLKLMWFSDAPPTAYTEAWYSGVLLDDPSMVRRATASYDLMRATALSPEASRDLIESTAKDFRQCTTTT